MDDEQSVAKVLKKMLEKLGYKAVIRNNCLEALKTFRQQANKYDLVITDLTMPNMTGLELAKQIHKIRSELPLILMTGYGENITKDIQKHYGIQEILGKPIVLRKLASTIRKVIDK